MNPMQIMNMLKSGNPQTVAVNLLRQQAGNNPIMNNLYNMAQNGDYQGIEQFARNVCAEKNINADEAVANLKQQLGM